MSQRARTRPAGDGRFGSQFAVFEDGTKALLKVEQFSTKCFRGVPLSKFHRREVAAYRLDRDLLGFGVVPETLLIRWRGHEASLQKYIEGFQGKDLVPGVFDRKLADWKYRVSELANRINMASLLNMVVLDLIINNADRHSKNLIIDTINNKIYAIDNSTSFGPCYKLYKNIFHKYFFLRNFVIPSALLEKLGSLSLADFRGVLGSLLSPTDVEFVYWRTQFVVRHSDRLCFLRMSKGNFGNNDFPDYQHWFKAHMTPKPDKLVLNTQPTPGMVLSP